MCSRLTQDYRSIPWLLDKGAALADDISVEKFPARGPCRFTPGLALQLNDDGYVVPLDSEGREKFIGLAGYRLILTEGQEAQATVISRKADIYFRDILWGPDITPGESSKVFVWLARNFKKMTFHK